MDANGLLTRQKLTKGFFLSLPKGVYLVSNHCVVLKSGCITPVFNEHVVGQDQRRAQWDRIRRTGAAQRVCDVYRSSEDCKQMMQWRTQISPNAPSIIICERDDGSSVSG
jgi:hypothetical protein